MAVRARFSQEVIYGHFSEFMGIANRLEEHVREKGWRPGSMWYPIAGRNNIVVYETEYDSLAEYEREQDAVYADADFMKLLRELSNHTVQGSGFSEILMEAPTPA